MSNGIYIATGQVIDRDTSQGVAGLSIEAWDSSPQRTQMLGNTKTDENGRFSISFDLKKFNYETAPDLFFKVLRGEQLLESTESSVLWNVNTQESVTIKIRTIRTRAAGRDRITTAQVTKAVDFYQQSDFKGVFNDYRTKATTSLGFIADMFKNSFSNMDLKPLRVKGSRQNDVINQDVNVARTNLESKNVVVKEVVPYKPGLNSESLKNIATIPRNIKPGQEVRLFVENGKVRYYSIVKTGTVADTRDSAAPSATVPGDVTKNLETHTRQLTGLQEELKTAKEDAAKKDQVITALQQQIEQLQKSHSEIDTLLKSENFTRLIKEMDQPKPAPTKDGKKDKGPK